MHQVDYLVEQGGAAVDDLERHVGEAVERRTHIVDVATFRFHSINLMMLRIADDNGRLRSCPVIAGSATCGDCSIVSCGDQKGMWLMVRFALLAVLSCVLPAAAADRTTALLGELADAPGPSGFEEPVRAIMVEHMRPFAKSITYDGLGSVIADTGGSGPRVMVDAHMDELGGVIRRTTPDGYLTMQMLGGWLDSALVGQRWIILGAHGPVHAVTGIRDIHLASPEERTKAVPRSAIFLDVGAHSAAGVAALGVTPGDPVVPDSPFQELNGTGNYVGKAFDDRVGCAAVIELMRRMSGLAHPNHLIFVATVQEEIGLRGARTASNLVRPDVGIAIEGGVTGDTRDAAADDSQVVLGGGPGIFLYDFDELPNRKLVALVNKVAADNRIPLQHDLVVGYGDDSAEMQSSGGGAPSINFVVPARYTHAHNGIMNRADFDRLVDLMAAVLRKLDANTVAGLKDFTPR